MYKGIIFDFFGVISTEVSPVWYRNNVPNDQAKKLQEELNPPMDRGEISLEDYFLTLGEKINRDADKVEEEFFDLVGINQDVLSLIKKLKQLEFLIALCSNAESSFIRQVFETHQLTPLFDAIIVSSEVKFAKPDVRIFEHTLKQMNLEAQETVFIDDNIHNVEAAKSIGITSIHFKNAEQLEKELTKLGI